MADAQDQPRDVDQLRSDIAETRAEMAGTIDEIQGRLRPRNMVQRRTAAVQARLKQMRESGQDLPVAAVAGAGTGLAALATAGGVVRRRRHQAELERQRADAGGAAIRALAAVVGLVALLLSRRRRRPLTVRQVMSTDLATVSSTDTLVAAAERMAGLDVGAIPVCSIDGRLEGILTDRDIVVKTVAQGGDPTLVTVGQVAQPHVITIDADQPVEAALRTMSEHAVRRLPVVDGDTLVGMVTQADLAIDLDDDVVGELVERISAAPGDERGV